MPGIDERVARLETQVQLTDAGVIASLSEMRSALAAQVDRVESKVDRLHSKFNGALVIAGPALALLIFGALTRG